MQLCTIGNIPSILQSKHILKLKVKKLKLETLLEHYNNTGSSYEKFGMSLQIGEDKCRVHACIVGRLCLVKTKGEFKKRYACVVECNKNFRGLVQVVQMA